MGLFERFVVGSGAYISLFCSSVFRIDPFYFCEFNCVYCYARRIIENIEPLEYSFRLLKAFKKLLKLFERRGIPKPVFRMSTLTEPFMGIEKNIRVVEKFLDVIKYNDVKLIINTKSKMILEEPWVDKIRELASDNRVLVQISIMSLDEELSKSLEIGSPSPYDRLEIVKVLSKVAPIVVRIQPIIFGLNENEVFELIKESYKRGARQVILEFLKLSDLRELDRISRVSGVDLRRDIYYSPNLTKQFVVKPNLRREYLKMYLEVAKRLKIDFSTCKEGFIRFHTAEDCCGMHHMGKYVAKKTIADELFGFGENKIVIDGEILNRMPSELKKRIKRQYDFIKRVLNRNDLLKEVIL